MAGIIRVLPMPPRNVRERERVAGEIRVLQSDVGAYTGLTRTQLRHAAQLVGEGAITDAAGAMRAALHSFKQIAGIDRKVLNTSGAQLGDLSAAVSPDEDPRLNKNVPYRPKALVFVRSLGRVGRVESVLKSKSDQFVYRVALLDAHGASKGEEALAPHADLEPRRSKALKQRVTKVLDRQIAGIIGQTAKTRGSDLIAKLDMAFQFLDSGGDTPARHREAQTLSTTQVPGGHLPKYMRVLSNLERRLLDGDFGGATLVIDTVRPAFVQVKTAQKPAPAAIPGQARVELIDYHQRHRGDLGPGWPNQLARTSTLSFGKALKSRPLQAAAHIRALVDSAQRGAELKADQFTAVRDLLTRARSKADVTTEQGLAGKRAIARALKCSTS
jgi:hypothetical protein